MAIHLRMRVNTLAAAVLAVVSTAPVASAQSQAELRRENLQLQSQVRDLQAELEAARRRISELEAQIAQLQAALQAVEPNSLTIAVL